MYFKNEAMMKRNDDKSSWEKEFVVDNDKLLPTNDDIIKVQVADSKIIDEASEKIKEQKSKKSKIFNISFFLLNIVVLVIILVVQLNKDGVTSISEAFLGNVGLRYVFLAALMFALIMIVDSLRTYILIKKSTKRNMPIISYKGTATEKYYDSITPMSFGGQPFMIFYLSSRQIKPSVATSIPVARLMFSQIAFVLTTIVVLLCNMQIFDNVTTESNVVYVISIISLVAIVLLIAGIIILSTSKKIAPKLVMGTLKLGHKMHLVKDYEQTFTKIMRHVLEYQKSMIYFTKDIFTSLSMFTLSVGMFFLKALIPYFIYLAMIPNPAVSFWEIFARIMLCDLVAHIIPFPGGAGVVELSFNALFRSLFTDGTLFWAMLLYRFFSYYIYLLQGFVIILYDFVIGNKRRDTREERVARRMERKRIKQIDKENSSHK